VLLEFLKTKAKGGIYLNLIKHIQKTAKALKADISVEFGARPKTVRPNIVDTAISAGSFSVPFSCMKYSIV
jgi:hypothetical protein